MRKILLGSTALAVGAAMFAAPVSADVKTPSLEISGSATAGVYIFKQKQREAQGGGGRGHHFAMDSRLNFEVFGKVDGLGGLEYQWLVGINADPNAKQSVEVNRFKFKGEWGTFFIGNEKGVEDIMAFGAHNILVGAGGWNNSTFFNIIRKTSGTTNSWKGRMKYATKVSFITPRFHGFQAGVSFTPDSKTGYGALRTQDSFPCPNDEHSYNVVAGTVNYKTKLDFGLNVKASATIIHGKTKMANSLSAMRIINPANPNPVIRNYEDTLSYMIGTELGYGDWDLGVCYIDNGTSQEDVSRRNNDAGQIWKVGLGFNYGVDKFSAGWLGSWRKVGQRFNSESTQAGARSDFGRASMNVYSLGWERKLAPGLSIFAEGNVFDMHTDPAYYDQKAQNNAFENTASLCFEDGRAVNENRGHVFVIGSKINF